MVVGSIRTNIGLVWFLPIQVAALISYTRHTTHTDAHMQLNGFYSIPFTANLVDNLISFLKTNSVVYRQKINILCCSHCTMKDIMIYTRTLLKGSFLILFNQQMTKAFSCFRLLSNQNIISALSLKYLEEYKITSKLCRPLCYNIILL